MKKRHIVDERISVFFFNRNKKRPSWSGQQTPVTSDVVETHSYVNGHEFIDVSISQA